MTVKDFERRKDELLKRIHQKLKAEIYRFKLQLNTYCSEERGSYEACWPKRLILLAPNLFDAKIF